MAIEEVMDLDTISAQHSIIHDLEGRVKLIIALAIIVFCVFSDRLIVPVVLEIFLLICMYVAKLPFKQSFKRIALLLPFGGLIIIFQPFIHSGNVIWTWSFLQVTDLGLNWTILLFSRLVVSLTTIVYLSSTSPMQEVVQSFRKLGMPRDLSMILSIMVRFLFIFYDELKIIRESQKSRNFDIYNQSIPYKWRLKQAGYTVAMMFLNAYEKGEDVYLSMVSRCFSDKSELYNSKISLGRNEYVYAAIVIIIIVALQLSVIFLADHLGYFGISLSLQHGHVGL